MNNKAMLDEMRQKLIAWLAKYDHLMKEGYLPNVTETLSQILSLETKDCRIAVVKKEGELPFPDENLNNRLNYQVDVMSKAHGSVIEAYRLGQQDMQEDNYVQEVKLSE